MQNEKINELFDAAGLILKATDRNRQSSDVAVSHLLATVESLQRLPTAVREDIDSALVQALENASQSTTSVFIDRLSKAADSAESAARRFERTESWVGWKFGLLTTLFTMLGVATACALIYVALPGNVKDLIEERNAAVQHIRQAKNIDLGFCGDRLCARIDETADPITGGYRVLATVD